MLDDIVFIFDYIRRKLPCGIGKRLMPDAHAISARLSHRPTWVPDDDDTHPVPRTRRRGENLEQKEEEGDVPETEAEELDRLGLEGADREFVMSMKAPKHSMLKELVAFEEQQRDMLHAIEALNKVTRRRPFLQKGPLRPHSPLPPNPPMSLPLTPRHRRGAPRSARGRWQFRKSSS